MNGKRKFQKFSPIIEAIAAAEASTTGEIRVHLSRRYFERDPYSRAKVLFTRFEMHRTAKRNGVLLYVNLRKHRFAIHGDEGIHRVVGQHYWENLARNLSENLRSTHSERAIAIAVLEIGATLKKYFPADLDHPNPNELADEVSRD